MRVGRRAGTWLAAAFALLLIPTSASAAPTLDNDFLMPTANSVGTESRLVAGPDGNVWVTLPNVSKLARITPSGTVTEFDTADAAASPTAIIATDTHIFYAESAANKIAKLDPNNPAAQTSFNPNNDLAGPRGLTIGPDGNLWIVSSVNGKAVVATQDGVHVNTFDLAAQTGQRDIALGSDGNLYITGFGFDNILRVTQAGVVTKAVPDAGTNDPVEIVTGSDGNLWYTAAADNSVVRLTTDGTATPFPLLTAGSDPQGITLAPDGNVWAAQPFANSVARVEPNGTVTEFPTIPDSLTRGVGIGADEKLYYTAPGTLDATNRVGRVNLDLPVDGGDDTTAPVISKQRFAPAVFAVSKKETAKVAESPPLAKGSKLRFRLSEQSDVKVTVKRVIRGRRVDGKCKRKADSGKKCKLRRKVGVLVRRDVGAGKAKIAFSGRIGKKALKPGLYQASLQATDEAGNKSAKRKAGFRIIEL